MTEHALIGRQQFNDNMLGGSITRVDQVQNRDNRQWWLHLRVEHVDAPTVLVKVPLCQDLLVWMDAIPQESPESSSHGNAIPQDSPRDSDLLRARLQMGDLGMMVADHMGQCEHAQVTMGRSDQRSYAVCTCGWGRTR